jgi:protease II
MADVKVQQTKENAVLLLDAADKAKEDVSVVRTTAGSFVVDEALAKKAGVEYTTEDDEAKAFDAKVKADDEEAGVQRDKANPRKVTAKKAAAAKTTAAKE